MAPSPPSFCEGVVTDNTLFAMSGSDLMYSGTEYFSLLNLDDL